MHSDIIKSVSRLITERKHTISSALVWSAQQATSDFLLFLSLLPPEVNIGKPNPLRVCTRTNTPTQHVIASCLQELQVIHGRLVTALRCAPLCGESLNTGTNVKGGGDTVMCVCVCGRRKGVGHLQTTPTSPYLQRGGLCSQRLNTFSERR